MLSSSAMTSTDAELPSVVAPSLAGRKSTAAGLFAQPLAPLLTIVGITALVILAISAGRPAHMVAALWAASGLAAAVWLRSGRGFGFDMSFGALVAFGLLAAQFLAGAPPGLAAWFTLANMAEIVIAVFLARRFAPTLKLTSVEGACRFIVSAAVAPAAVGGLIAAVSDFLLREKPPLATFQAWWFGHGLGFAIMGVFVMAFDKRTIRALLTGWRAVETIGLLGLLTAACILMNFVVAAPLGFVMVPLLILIAIRLRILGVATALVLIMGIALVALATGAGPWRQMISSLPERIMLLQLTILFGYLPILLLASLLEERDRLSSRAKAGQLRAERASAAKSRLLANVAHEIKSPIGGIIGIGELWSSGQLGPVTETQAEMAAMLVKTARQVEALSHDLLDVARAESGAVKVELRPTDIPGILEDIRRATVMRPEARQMTIKTQCLGDGLVALADSQRLAQVIDNLATNAVKYGGEGGEIMFRAERLIDCVRIEVIDKGPGLSPDKQAQLFEPFNRLGLERSAVEGHGIGLALAKRLVELQGGSIGVISTPGEGSTFWIELPPA
jgi:signal transduction histidine kinase